MNSSHSFPGGRRMISESTRPATGVLASTHCSSPLHVFGSPISGKGLGRRSLDSSSRGWDVRIVLIIICRCCVGGVGH